MPARNALLIGNSAFRHAELARLSAPANDVRELAALLEDPAIGGFTTELKLDIGLVDARRAIKRLFDDRHPDDLVLFYYSGHGLLDTHGRFYLAMTETDPADPDAGSVDETWLRGVFDSSLSGRQVAILDCCHSGAFIPGEPPRKDAAAGPILTEKTLDPTGHGRFIMAATTATTSAFEQEGRSLYTRHLAEGLTSGAAAPESDTVTVLDLHDFVKRRVAETAPASMRPQLWRDASLNPDAAHLAIARNPRPRPKLSEEEVAALWSEDLQAVELAIFRMMETAQGGGTLAEDACKVLRERLTASDSLPYTLGARIAAFVDPDETGKALEEAEQRAAEAEGRLSRLDQERHALTERLETERTRGEEEIGKRDAEIERLKTDATAASDRADEMATALEASQKQQAELDSTLANARNEIERLKQALADLQGSTGVGPPVATLVALGRIFARTMLIASGGALFAVVYASIDPNHFERVVDFAGRFFPFVDASPTAQLEDPETATPDAAVSAQGECTLTTVDRCRPGSSFVEADGFPEMVVIPAGTFMMGSPDTEDDRDDDEGPQQDIKIARFALARSEVTFDQWEACAAGGFCTSNPTPEDEDWERSSRPVINVSWNDAQEFIDWLNSAVEGDPYRLPSEAEWEYAARADEDAAFPWGSTWDPAQANGNRAVGQTTEVGNYPANAFGLVDMIGNVWEWTEDCWRDNLDAQPEDGASVTQGLGANCSARIVRGGSWNVDPRYLRSANRNRWNDPDDHNNTLGFRPARTLIP